MRVIQSVALVCALLVADAAANTCGAFFDTNSANHGVKGCQDGYTLQRERLCGSPDKEFDFRCQRQNRMTQDDGDGKGCCIKEAEDFAWTCGGQAAKFELKCPRAYTLAEDQICGPPNQVPNTPFSCREIGKGGRLRQHVEHGQGCCIKKRSKCGDLATFGYECNANHNINKNLVCKSDPEAKVPCFGGESVLSEGGQDDKNVCCVQESTCGAEVLAHGNLKEEQCPKDTTFAGDNICGRWTGNPCWDKGALNTKSCCVEA